MGFKGYLSLQLKLNWVELDWAGAKVDQKERKVIHWNNGHFIYRLNARANTAAVLTVLYELIKIIIASNKHAEQDSNIEWSRC